MNTIIYSNMIPFIALLILLLLDHYNPLFERQQRQLFRLVVIITMIILLAISADYLLSTRLFGTSWDWQFRRVTSFANFASAPLIPILLYKIFYTKKVNIFYYVPGIINIGLCFISMFNGIVFYITDKNEYLRGPLFVIPFGIMNVYIIILIIRMATCNSKKKKNECVFLSFVIIALGISMVLEIFKHFKFLSWDCAAMSIVMYYLLVNINNATYDPLTGAYNRAIYMKELSEIEMKNSCVVALLDINNFKEINDTQGHDAGDHCLIQFVQILQLGMDKGAGLYRIGGDEFAIVSKKWDELKMTTYLERMLKETMLQKISFASGYVVYKADKPIEEAIVQADKNMYINKSEMKKIE